ncbi:MAG: sugar phosphate isomerase/epimerase family protein [Gemmataceae bacterium]
MQIGFVSAILPDLSLEEVLKFAADEGFGCVELMCWPPGQAERRYAGVCHLDVSNFTDEQVHHTRHLMKIHGIAISGLGYYPNPLDPDASHRQMVAAHLRKVIAASAKLGINVVNTFIGRDWHKSVDENWPAFRELWPGLIRDAESAGVRVGIENCPMLFSADEWPGGKNLAMSPAVWRRMFAEIPSKNFGLNFDPSHLIIQHIDCAQALREFGSRLIHVHAKDLRIDKAKLYDEGILGLGWAIPKLPGLGDVDWGAFFAELTATGYDGPICVEVEDRAYERSFADRVRSLRQSKRFLEQYVS